jgi:hypothetical protein
MDTKDLRDLLAWSEGATDTLAGCQRRFAASGLPVGGARWKKAINTGVVTTRPCGGYAYERISVQLRDTLIGLPIAPVGLFDEEGIIVIAPDGPAPTLSDGRTLVGGHRIFRDESNVSGWLGVWKVQEPVRDVAGKVAVGCFGGLGFGAYELSGLRSIGIDDDGFERFRFVPKSCKSISHPLVGMWLPRWKRPEPVAFSGFDEFYL